MPKIRDEAAATMLRSRGNREEFRRLLNEQYIGIYFGKTIIFLALSCLGTKQQNDMGEDFCDVAVGHGTVLHELVNVPIAAFTRYKHEVVCRNAHGRIYSDAHDGAIGQPDLRNNLMTDVLNTGNKSFMQETRLMENEYSVNRPTKFVYQGQEEARRLLRGIAYHSTDGDYLVLEYKSGKYYTFPHAIELLNRHYEDVFPILTFYPELENYLSPFMDA